MLLRPVRLATAFALVATVFINLGMNLVDPPEGFTVPNYFSYFTIVSCLGASAVLFSEGMGRRVDARWRGGVTLMMTVTMVVYVVLLSGLVFTITEPSEVRLWVDVVLHYLGPLVVLVDWVADPPTSGIDGRTMLWWLSFPAAYLGYSLIRGLVVGWFPYPFIDPAIVGWGGVVTWSVAITVAVVAMAAGVGVLGRLRRPAVAT